MEKLCLLNTIMTYVYIQNDYTYEIDTYRTIIIHILPIILYYVFMIGICNNPTNGTQYKRYILYSFENTLIKAYYRIKCF